MQCLRINSLSVDHVSFVWAQICLCHYHRKIDHCVFWEVKWYNLSEISLKLMICLKLLGVRGWGGSILCLIVKIWAKESALFVIWTLHVYCSYLSLLKTVRYLCLSFKCVVISVTWELHLLCVRVCITKGGGLIGFLIYQYTKWCWYTINTLFSRIVCNLFL